MMRKCRDCLSVSFQQAMHFVQKERAILVDVRTREEYDRWHLAGSVLISLTQMPGEVEKRYPDRSRKFVMYCLSGARSMVACQLLLEAGYKNVYSIEGGVKP